MAPITRLAAEPRLELPQGLPSARQAARSVSRRGWAIAVLVILLVVLAVLAGIVARRHFAEIRLSSAKFFASTGLPPGPDGDFRSFPVVARRAHAW